MRRALDLDPNDPIALQNLGVVLTYSERFDEAKEVFKDALNLEHPYPEQIRKNLEVVDILKEQFQGKSHKNLQRSLPLRLKTVGEEELNNKSIYSELFRGGDCR